MKDVKNFIITFWYSYLLAFLSVAYGFQLLLEPEIIGAYKTYERLRDSFGDNAVGLVFILLGILYFIATTFSIKKLRSFLLPIFSALWMFFSLSFRFADTSNTVWIFCLGMVALCIGISLRGDYAYESN